MSSLLRWGEIVKIRKPLVSSAPATSILNARTFHYTSSGDTDLRKTFARIVRERAKAAAVVSTADNNVRALNPKTSEAPLHAIGPNTARR